MKTPVDLAIGGLDPSAGAGLLVDTLTVSALRGRPLGVATAVTVQSGSGVFRVSALTPRLVVGQAEQLFEDDPPHVVKLGMLADAGIAQALGRLFARRLGRRPLVIDPVLRSSSGAALFRGRLMRDYAPLFAEARVVTPNLAEAAHLLGEPIGARTSDRAEAAYELSRLLHCAIILKGGHAPRDAADLVADRGEVNLLGGSRIPGEKRGTGCRFASALATRLALGDDLLAAARVAKAHVRRYLDA
jgi:hydroxymethylpyrimidine/phosphomethylpyrimidine kinase